MKCLSGFHRFLLRKQDRAQIVERHLASADLLHLCKRAWIIAHLRQKDAEVVVSFGHVWIQ